mmetsp:Transcript_18865/g.49040  ORF Transcript_18865/g.49040 Transcript_18865/m.49040 type:complete len:227 (-) Transcript_18865:1-681(-)
MVCPGSVKKGTVTQMTVPSSLANLRGLPGVEFAGKSISNSGSGFTRYRIVAPGRSSECGVISKGPWRPSARTACPGWKSAGNVATNTLGGNATASGSTLPSGLALKRFRPVGMRWHSTTMGSVLRWRTKLSPESKGAPTRRSLSKVHTHSLSLSLSGGPMTASLAATIMSVHAVGPGGLTMLPPQNMERSSKNMAANMAAASDAPTARRRPNSVQSLTHSSLGHGA